MKEVPGNAADWVKNKWNGTKEFFSGLWNSTKEGSKIHGKILNKVLLTVLKVLEKVLKMALIM